MVLGNLGGPYNLSHFSLHQFFRLLYDFLQVTFTDPCSFFNYLDVKFFGRPPL